MDAVRKLILDKLQENGLTMKEASLRIGMNHAYLQQFLKRGVPAVLDEVQRGQLADLLGVPENELRGPSPRLPKREHSKPGNSLPSVTPPTKTLEPRHNLLDNLTQIATTFGKDDLPLFSSRGGTGGILIISHEAVDYIARPAPLLRVRDGYGMIVTGDTMSPKIENGSTLLVNPHLPPRNGDVCVFRKNEEDGTPLAMIRLLRRYNDDLWFVHQLAPKRDSVLKRSEWQSCHVVVGNYFVR